MIRICKTCKKEINTIDSEGFDLEWCGIITHCDECIDLFLEKLTPQEKEVLQNLNKRLGRIIFGESLQLN